MQTNYSGEYTIRLNENQLRLILDALEEWARLRMGQTIFLADALAFQHFNYSEHTDKEFDDRIRRRDEGEILLKQAMDRFTGTDPSHWYKTGAVKTVLDMWSVIRNFFWHQIPEEQRDQWSRDADPLFLWGPEPGIKVEKHEEDPLGPMPSEKKE